MSELVRAYCLRSAAWGRPLGGRALLCAWGRRLALPAARHAERPVHGASILIAGPKQLFRPELRSSVGQGPQTRPFVT